MLTLASECGSVHGLLIAETPRRRATVKGIVAQMDGSQPSRSFPSSGREISPNVSLINVVQIPDLVF